VPCRFVWSHLPSSPCRCASSPFASLPCPCESCPCYAIPILVSSSPLCALPFPFRSKPSRTVQCLFDASTRDAMRILAVRLLSSPCPFGSLRHRWPRCRLASCLHGSMPYRVRSGPVPASQIHVHSTRVKSGLSTSVAFQVRAIRRRSRQSPGNSSARCSDQ
jgi:hypothetical protein